MFRRTGTEECDQFEVAAVGKGDECIVAIEPRMPPAPYHGKSRVGVDGDRGIEIGHYDDYMVDALDHWLEAWNRHSSRGSHARDSAPERACRRGQNIRRSICLRRPHRYRLLIG